MTHAHAALAWGTQLFLCLLAAAGPAGNPAIEKAMASVRAAEARAAADPSRPVYHFRPPAQWMNDPNGVIYHRGSYHVFYQHNPYGDQWGHMHWGHARSKDLIHWEHLPIALWPSEEAGEAHCFSGCARVSAAGVPMLFYTSVSGETGKRPNEQWAATGDADWTTWRKHGANPLLSLSAEGMPAFGGDWRDPFIFTHGDQTYMVLGADLGGEAVIPVFEARSPELDQWAYRGILYRQPKSTVPFFECPNFFQLGDKWILLYSPYRPIEYRVGSLDTKSLTFAPETGGILDHGEGGAFYASNVLFDAGGRCVLLGWVRGFAPNLGWNGCLSLPRELTVNEAGLLEQNPVNELAALRGQHHLVRETPLEGGEVLLARGPSNTFELLVQVQLSDETGASIVLTPQCDGVRPLRITGRARRLEIDGVAVDVPRPSHAGSTTIHLFVDRSVLEVFYDRGSVAVTRILPYCAEGWMPSVVSEGGPAKLVHSDVWQLKSIW